MSITKARDVAFVRFRAPDLARMRAFLLDFGMVDATPAEAAGDRLFMRGAGASPYVHVTERGQPEFAGFGIWVRHREDLDVLARVHGLPVEKIDAPGGGFRVRLRDPDGFVVDAIADQQEIEGTAETPPVPWNQAGHYPRVGEFKRISPGPSHVRRLGHVVLAVRDFRTSEAWYKEQFGLLTSDEIRPAPEVAIGAFLRCDRGEIPSDHHALFILERPDAPAFIHAAFEVADLDDLMAGHDHLRRAGYAAQWGVGRHILGSQIFDYWLDPWGHEVEHWTDGDQLRAVDGGGIGSLGDLMGVQWGMPMPPIPGAPT